METRCRAEIDAIDDLVAPGIVFGDAHSNRVDIRRQNRHRKQLAHRDCQHTAACAEVERIAHLAGANNLLDDFEATRRRSVMTGSEGLAGVDFDRDVMRLHLVSVMGPMHKEPSGADRLQAFEGFGDPVDIGNDLTLDRRIRKLFGEQVLEARRDLVFLVGHQIDGCLPDIRLLVDLGGRDRKILFA